LAAAIRWSGRSTLLKRIGTPAADIPLVPAYPVRLNSGHSP
jgi:hypothetical protein